MLSAQKFVVVNVYAPQSLTEKKIIGGSLNQIISHDTTSNLLVLFIGDFNSTRSLGDRSNNDGSDRTSRMTFNSWIHDHNLVEIQLSNAVFTWVGSQERRSRLDRALSSPNWFTLNNWSEKH